MCRIAVILSLNKPIPLGNVVVGPKKSLIIQSFCCYERTKKPIIKESSDVDSLNGDGFGVGWYKYDHFDIKKAKNIEACVFKSFLPAWGDQNLYNLSKGLFSNLFFIHLRSADYANIIQPTLLNCHPFKYKNFLFMHNGCLAKNIPLRRELLNSIKKDNAYEYAIMNEPTDSVILFCLFIDQLDEDKLDQYTSLDLAQILRNLCERVSNIVSKYKVTSSVLNFYLGDGKCVIATRYTIFSRDTKKCSPSLYCCAGNEWKQDNLGNWKMHYSGNVLNSFVLASEPLNDQREEWMLVPETSFTIFDKNTVLTLKITDDLPNSIRILKSSLFKNQKCLVFDELETKNTVDTCANSEFEDSETENCKHDYSLEMKITNRVSDPLSKFPPTKLLNDTNDSIIKFYPALFYYDKLNLNSSHSLKCMCIYQKVLFCGDSIGNLLCYSFEGQLLFISKYHLNSILTLKTLILNEKNYLISIGYDSQVSISELINIKDLPIEQIKFENCIKRVLNMSFIPVNSFFSAIEVVQDKLYLGSRLGYLLEISLNLLFEKYNNCMYIQSEMNSPKDCELCKNSIIDECGVMKVYINFTRKTVCESTARSRFLNLDLLIGTPDINTDIMGIIIPDTVESYERLFKLINENQKQLAPINCIKIYKNLIITCGDDGVIMIYKDLKIHKIIPAFSFPINNLAIDDESGLLYSVSQKGGVKIWSLRTFQLKSEFSNLSFKFFEVFGKDGIILSAKSFDEVYLWNSENFDYENKLISGNNFDRLADLCIHLNDKDCLQIFAVSVDGKLIKWHLLKKSNSSLIVKPGLKENNRNTVNFISLRKKYEEAWLALQNNSFDDILRIFLNLIYASDENKNLMKSSNFIEILNNLLLRIGLKTQILILESEDEPTLVAELGNESADRNILLYHQYNLEPNLQNFFSSTIKENNEFDKLSDHKILIDCLTPVIMQLLTLNNIKSECSTKNLNISTLPFKLLSVFDGSKSKFYDNSQIFSDYFNINRIDYVIDTSPDFIKEKSLNLVIGSIGLLEIEVVIESETGSYSNSDTKIRSNPKTTDLTKFSSMRNLTNPANDLYVLLANFVESMNNENFTKILHDEFIDNDKIDEVKKSLNCSASSHYSKIRNYFKILQEKYLKNDYIKTSYSITNISENSNLLYCANKTKQRNISKISCKVYPFQCIDRYFDFIKNNFFSKFESIKSTNSIDIIRITSIEPWYIKNPTKISEIFVESSEKIFGYKPKMKIEMHTNPMMNYLKSKFKCQIIRLVMNSDNIRVSKSKNEANQCDISSHVEFFKNLILII